MATYLDGNVRKATPNTVTAMKNSAANRQCPVCGRKSALVWDTEQQATYCRWSSELKRDRRGVPVRADHGRHIPMCHYYKGWDED